MATYLQRCPHCGWRVGLVLGAQLDNCPECRYPELRTDPVQPLDLRRREWPLSDGR